MFPPSSLHQSYFSIKNFPSVYFCKIFESPFSIREILSVIKSSKKHSSPGADQIDYEIIETLPESHLQFLLDILNELLCTVLFPPSWHQSLMYLIPKNSPGKYRPISLTSCILKILEKLVLTRLDWWVESSRILPSSQYGFRKKRILFGQFGHSLLGDPVWFCV